VNAEIQRIVDDMFDTMYAEEGIGLAATQVDIHKRIIVIDVSENRDGRLVLINPELLEKSGETGIEEGCLSIPEQRALVPRAEKVKIRALDRDGNPFELEADDLLAICIQHEMDHLVGKLFIDYLSPLKQQRIRQKVEKLDRAFSRITSRDTRNNVSKSLRIIFAGTLILQRVILTRCYLLVTRLLASLPNRIAWLVAAKTDAEPGKSAGRRAWITCIPARIATPTGKSAAGC
jgi:peptide deformylase